MTLPASIAIGGHATDAEIVDMQLAVQALLDSHVAGVLSVANGGTAQSTYAQGDLIYASAANTLAKLAKGTSGQLLQIGATIPAWAGDTAWTAPTFQNSWVNSPGSQPAGFFKDSFGFIHLRGAIKNGSAINTVAFILPTGYRPATTSSFICRSFNGVPTDIHCVSTVDSAGNVLVGANNTGATNFISLDGITFDTR